MRAMLRRSIWHHLHKLLILLDTGSDLSLLCKNHRDVRDALWILGRNTLKTLKTGRPGRGVPVGLGIRDAGTSDVTRVTATFVPLDGAEGRRGGAGGGADRTAIRQGKPVRGGAGRRREDVLFPAPTSAPPRRPLVALACLVPVRTGLALSRVVSLAQALTRRPQAAARPSHTYCACIMRRA